MSSVERLSQALSIVAKAHPNALSLDDRKSLVLTAKELRQNPDIASPIHEQYAKKIGLLCADAMTFSTKKRISYINHVDGRIESPSFAVAKFDKIHQKLNTLPHSLKAVRSVLNQVLNREVHGLHEYSAFDRAHLLAQRRVHTGATHSIQSEAMDESPIEAKSALQHFQGELKREIREKKYSNGWTSTISMEQLHANGTSITVHHLHAIRQGMMPYELHSTLNRVREAIKKLG